MKKNIRAVFVLIALFVFLLTEIAFSKGRWVKFGDNWRYELHAGGGDYVTEKWRGIYEDGLVEKVYYFDYYGNMATGPIVIKGELYIYGDDGAAITTGYDIDGVHYETDGKGKVLGLPLFFDLSPYKVAVTMDTIMLARSLNTNINIYDDNNNISPTAPSNNY